jgi:hypothetical protein
MAGGAPKGNTNATKAKRWSAAIERAIEGRSMKSGQDELNKLAEALLDQCHTGDVSALKELGDRLEGRPAQSVTVMGDEDAPLQIAGRIILVKPSGG